MPLHFIERLHVDGRPVDCQVALAGSFFLRLRGLLARPRLTPRQALWLPYCDAIHTIGMRHAIDVVFVDRTGSVVRVCEAVYPMRARVCRTAACVVELDAGNAARLGIRIMSRLTSSIELQVSDRR